MQLLPHATSPAGQLLFRSSLEQPVAALKISRHKHRIRMRMLPSFSVRRANLYSVWSSPDIIALYETDFIAARLPTYGLRFRFLLQHTLADWRGLLGESSGDRHRRRHGTASRSGVGADV